MKRPIGRIGGSRTRERGEEDEASPSPPTEQQDDLLTEAIVNVVTAKVMRRIDEERIATPPPSPAPQMAPQPVSPLVPAAVLALVAAAAYALGRRSRG